MSIWLIMMFSQSVLIGSNRPALHRKLGLFSFLLAPCVLFSMIGVEMLNVTNSAQKISNSLLIHGVCFLFFPLFYIWAIVVRKKDNESHKRLMVLATLVLLIPGISRLISVTQILPDFGLNAIDARHLYLLILLSPAIAYDVANNGVVHRAYVTGVLFIFAWAVIAHFVWNTPWWLDVAPKLLGV